MFAFFMFSWHHYTVYFSRGYTNGSYVSEILLPEELIQCLREKSIRKKLSRAQKRKKLNEASKYREIIRV
jgi:hypothetical protein